jgi:hypothetical protein
MSDRIPSSGRSADRNLLFGILALQMDFISRDALIAAIHAWVLDKAKPLGQILVEHGAITIQARDKLEAVVELHVEMHSGDPQKSLATLSGKRIPGVRRWPDGFCYDQGLHYVPILLRAGSNAVR